ncbi:MAG: hypothetical protein ACI9ZF_000521 [Bradyrhizobium sp.]|jgi:hypothetical protein
MQLTDRDFGVGDGKFRGVDFCRRRGLGKAHYRECQRGGNSQTHENLAALGGLDVGRGTS